MANLASPFGSRPSWLQSALRAFLIEAALVGCLVASFFTVSGADNPLWFYLVMIFQFPSSLLWTIPAWRSASFFLHIWIAALVVSLQFILLLLWIRRPWRVR